MSEHTRVKIHQQSGITKTTLQNAINTIRGTSPSIGEILFTPDLLIVSGTTGGQPDPVVVEVIPDHELAEDALTLIKARYDTFDADGLEVTQVIPTRYGYQIVVAKVPGLFGLTNNLPLNYLDGFITEVLTAPLDQLQILPGEARNDVDTADIVSLPGMILDMTLTGAGGHDTGIIPGGQSIIDVWAIGGPTVATDVLGVTDGLIPVLPPGYVWQRRVSSWLWTGTAFERMEQYGKNRIRRFHLNDGSYIPLVGGAPAGKVSLALTNFVPSFTDLDHSGKVGLFAQFVPVAGFLSYLLYQHVGIVSPDAVFTSPFFANQISRIEETRYLETGTTSSMAWAALGGNLDLSLAWYERIY